MIRSPRSRADRPSVRDLRITPAPTAHPTEAKRRAVVEHLWRIGALLEQLEDQGARRLGRAGDHRRMREEIAGPVAHGSDPPAPPPSRSTRCAPYSRCSIRRSSLYAAVRSTGRWTAGWDPHGCGTRAPSFEPFLRWGTWVGGDRDGNPTRDRRGDTRGDGDPIRSRVARVRGRLAADRADALGLGERRSSEPGAATGAGSRRRGAAGPSRRSWGARSPTRRTDASSGCRRTAWPRRAPARTAATTGRHRSSRIWTSSNGRWTPAARRDSRGASSSTCGGRSRRSGSTWRRWRSASTPRCRRRRERSSRRRGRSGRRRRPARCSPRSAPSRRSRPGWVLGRASASS